MTKRGSGEASAVAARCAETEAGRPRRMPPGVRKQASAESVKKLVSVSEHKAVLLRHGPKPDHKFYSDYF